MTHAEEYSLLGVDTRPAALPVGASETIRNSDLQRGERRCVGFSGNGEFDVHTLLLTPGAALALTGLAVNQPAESGYNSKKLS